MEKESKSSRMEILIRVIIMMESSMEWVIISLFRCLCLGKPVKILRII
jgi:hypothetical protein